MGLATLVPLGVTTLTSNVPMPGGETAVIELGEFTTKVKAFVEPNLTAVAPLRSIPLMTTEVPPFSTPSPGLTPLTVGAGEPYAMLKAAPAEMAVTRRRPLTGTGTTLLSVVPLPS